MNRKKLADFFAPGADPVIMGPTASGKSALALLLAERFHGEIVSADSMQFYRGLDIGTAKPTPEERARVPHHLLDTMDLSEKSDIFRFRDAAEAAVVSIRARGRHPVLCGGSGLYLRAFLYGLDELPARAELRAELDAKYDNGEHFPELAAVMEKECPDDFARFSRHRRKLIRAREVFLLSGKQLSELQRHSRTARPDFRSFVLQWDRDELKKRIFLRTEEMLASGWIEEAERLIAHGLLASPTAWQALGYAQIGEYLAGRMSRADLAGRIATATWQFARRQQTWFAHQHPEAETITMPCAFE